MPAAPTHRSGVSRGAIYIAAAIALAAPLSRADAQVGSPWIDMLEHQDRVSDRLRVQARDKLAARHAGAQGRQDLLEARRLLEDARRRRPDDVQTIALLAATYELEDRGAEALALVARARDQASSDRMESVLSRVLAEQHLQRGTLARAEAEARRHLRTGRAVDADSYVLFGAVALGQGMVDEAAERFLTGLQLAERTPGLQQGEQISRALYGFALARHLGGDRESGRMALGRAMVFDGRLSLRRRFCDAMVEAPAPTEALARLLCGLALEEAGERDRALDVYRGLKQDAQASALVAPHLDRAERAEERARAPWRVIAAGTVATTGAAPAPLVDQQIRDRMSSLLRCELASRPEGLAPTRLHLTLQFETTGRLASANAVDPPAPLARLAGCLVDALQGLTLPSLPGAPTRAQVDVLVGPRPRQR